MKKKTRKFLLKLHLYLGLIPGIPLIIIGITGAFLTFAPQFKKWQQPELYSIKSQGKQLPKAGLIQKIAEDHPKSHLYNIKIFDEPGKTWTVFAYGPLKGENQFYRMHVNPYTGAEKVDTTSNDFIHLIESLHRNLTGGSIGRYIVGISSLLLIIMALSGLYLWIPLRKGSLRRLLEKKDALSWHNWTGLIAFPILIIMAFTGITITFQEPVLGLVYGITGSPKLPDSPQSTVPRDSTQHIQPGQIITKFQANYPGRIITGFGEPGSEKEPYKINWGFTNDLNPGDWGTTYFDQYNGEVLSDINNFEHSWGAIYEQTWWMFHTGQFFGTTGKLIWAIISLSLPVLFFTGLFRWLGKNRRKSHVKSWFKRLFKIKISSNLGAEISKKNIYS